MNDIVKTWLKVGTMLVVSRWLSGAPLGDRAWQMSALYTLIGFTAYHMVTQGLVNTAKYGYYQPVADDVVNFGTMMLVSRLLSGGNPFDPTWIYASVATLVGFAVYQLVVSKYVRGNELTYHPKLQDSIDDWAKFGTQETVLQLLMGGSLGNPVWAGTTVATLLGFTAYNLGVSRIYDMLYGL